MRIKKYLDQVAGLFDAEKRKCEKEKKCLRDALKKLKEREEQLESHMEKLKSDKAKKKLKNELKIVSTQRRKGENLLESLDGK